MGRRKKVAVEPELIVAEEFQPAKPRQVVEAEHTIRFRKPLDVATLDPELEEEEPDSEEFEEELEIEEPEEDQPRRRNTQSFRTKLKQELSGRGIGSDEQLKLRIDRLPYYHVNGNTGINAEKEFVRNIPCSKEFVLNDEYLDEVSRSCGPGAYWFTLRHKNTIVKMWHMAISGSPIAPAAAVLAQPGEAPATVAAVAAAPGYSPHLAQQIPPAPRTLKQELKELVEMKRLMRELSDEPAASAPAPPPAANPDPEVALLTLIARDDSVMEKLSKGALSKLLGGAATERDEWAEVAMEAIKSGQAPQIISSFIGAIFNGFGNLLPKGNNDGKAQVAPTQVQDQTQPGHQQQGQIVPGAQVEQPANPPAGAGGMAGDVHQHSATQESEVSPEDELIYAILGAMERQASIPETQTVINISIVRSPWLRESLDELISLPIDQLLALATAYYPPVAQMAHAREWVESLIASFPTDSEEGAGE